MTPIRVYVDAVAFLAPMVDGAEALEAFFEGPPTQGEADWQAQPQFLSPRASKRLSPQTRLALAIAESLTPALPEDAAWVFASSLGEGETLKVILDALRTPEMMVQPLRFQNAVHNAASGQWTVAKSFKAPATSIAALDHTVGAGLLKAGLQVALEGRSVGLILYDVPLPDPLDALQHMGLPVGAGLALRPEAGPETCATLTLSATPAPVSEASSAAARALIDSGNPIARVLPLLERLLGHGDGPVVLGLHGDIALNVEVALP
ncbi:MAG: beta-ketoacyl synthase chain length factor [Pseudomonadota bacterium]